MTDVSIEFNGLGICITIVVLTICLIVLKFCGVF